MDVASPVEPRIAGRTNTSGTPITFTAHKSITLATPFARDWRNRGFGLPTSSASLATFAGATVGGNGDSGHNGRRARYRYLHPPSATGEGRAS